MKIIRYALVMLSFFITMFYLNWHFKASLLESLFLTVPIALYCWFDGYFDKYK
jgi:hypothetical protein